MTPAEVAQDLGLSYTRLTVSTGAGWCILGPLCSVWVDERSSEQGHYHVHSLAVGPDALRDAVLAEVLRHAAEKLDTLRNEASEASARYRDAKREMARLVGKGDGR